jgi:hypothetical protein
VITTLAFATLLAAPAGADQRERHRQNDNRNPPEQTARAREDAPARERAVPRAQARREAEPPRQEATRQEANRQERRAAEPQRADAARRADDTRRADNSRDNRRDDNGRNNGTWRSDNNRRYDNRGYAYGARRYDTRHRYYYYYAAPRYVRPAVIHVVPYRPYVYRPSFSLGVYYGSGGYYPYGYTPRAYYEPVAGRPYGGVRITGAPRDARVFADGYFVGIVDDFDGIFQHVNLEAGPHHIEVDWGGYQPIAFDVYVRPGETTTFRADRY